ncbi:MAG: tRNA-dihydrouridine synthase [Candidatus Lokiarchaeia archaeon]
MIPVRNHVILAAMAGICDGKFCFEAARAGAGMVIIGGISFDAETIGAGLKIRARGRSEFHVELGNLEDFLSREVSTAKKGGAPVAVNVRVATLEGLLRAGEIVQNSGADAFELNSHCRQPEITELGGGQALLFDFKKLEEWIKSLREILKIPLMVKWRANVVDDVALAKALESMGVDAFHIDAMKPGYPKADLKVISIVSKKSETFLIGNNSINSMDRALEMLKAGAQVVSVARYTRNDPKLVGKLALEVENAL